MRRLSRRERDPVTKKCLVRVRVFGLYAVHDPRVYDLHNKQVRTAVFVAAKTVLEALQVISEGLKVVVL